MPIKRPEWFNILSEVAKKTEDNFRQKGRDFEIVVEEAIVYDVANQINRTMNRSRMKQPNAPKIAGVVSFWIRKLKPLHIHDESKMTFGFVNELVALKVGLAICEKYMTDAQGNQLPLRLDTRIMHDWVASFRYHSHSPHSSIISFEMLACEK